MCIVLISLNCEDQTENIIDIDGSGPLEPIRVI